MLIKVRSSDIELVVRSLYGNDYAFLQDPPAAEAAARLDAVLEEFLARHQQAYFFKVTDTRGALMGFFSVPVRNPWKMTLSFYLKPTARKQPYYQEFYQLIEQTLFAGVQQSLTTLNMPLEQLTGGEATKLNGPYRPFGSNIN